MIDVDAFFDAALEKFPVIETKRLILRDLSLYDISEIKEMNNDEKIVKFMHYGTRHNASDTFDYLIRLQAYKEAITWGIALRETDELIGIRSCFIDSAYEPVTVQGQMRHAYRKHGYTFEAYQAIISFLEEVGVKSIKANADKSNTAAIALLNKLGFQAEHRWPGFSFNDPNPDAILFTKSINGKEEDTSDWI